MKYVRGNSEKCCVTVAQVRKNKQDNRSDRRLSWTGRHELPGPHQTQSPRLVLCMQGEPGALVKTSRPQLTAIMQELNKLPVSSLPAECRHPKPHSKPSSFVLPKPSPSSPSSPPPPASTHARWQPVSGRYLFLHYLLALFYLLSKPSSIYSLVSALVVYISLLCLLCHLLKWELRVFGPLRPFPYINLNHTRCGPLLQRKTNWFRRSQYAYCFLTQINIVVCGVWGFFCFFFSLPQEPKVIQLKDSRKCD